MVFGVPWLHVVLTFSLTISLFYFQQKKDARIVVGMFHEDQARKVFCEVRNCQYCVCSLNWNLSNAFILVQLVLLYIWTS